MLVGESGVAPEPYAGETEEDWVLSAPDLARVVTALRPEGAEPIVPQTFSGHGLGSAGHVEWLPNGTAFVLLLNADVDPAPFAQAIRDGLAAGPAWPAGDLFEDY